MSQSLTSTELQANSAADTVLPVRTRQLSKSYGNVRAVQDLSFELRPGEIVGLLGSNGAGKTTTLKLLLGLLHPTAGQATVFGVDCDREPHKIKQLIGYVPDEPAFYEYLTGRETLEFVAEVRGLQRKQTVAALEPVIADLEFAAHMNELVAGYSHGTKKKLAILTALVHKPKVLLLDEPTNGLDPPSAAKVKHALRELASQGAAVLLSTHLLDMADRICGRAIVLVKGTLQFEGTLEALRELVGPGTLEDVFLRFISGEEASRS